MILTKAVSRFSRNKADCPLTVRRLSQLRISAILREYSATLETFYHNGLRPFSEKKVQGISANCSKTLALDKGHSLNQRPTTAIFRSCTNRLNPFQQGMKSNNHANSLGRANGSLIIFGKPAGIVEPGQRTFNDPPLGQNLPFGFYACETA